MQKEQNLTQDLNILTPIGEIAHLVEKDIEDHLDIIKKKLMEKVASSKNGDIGISYNIPKLYKSKIIKNLKSWAKMQSYEFGKITDPRIYDNYYLKPRVNNFEISDKVKKVLKYGSLCLIPASLFWVATNASILILTVIFSIMLCSSLSYFWGKNDGVSEERMNKLKGPDFFHHHQETR